MAINISELRKNIDLKLKCKSHIMLGELVVETSPERLLKTVTFLKESKDLQFKQLSDICGVDYVGREKRFEVIYHLLSMKYNQRVRIKVPVAEGEVVPSICGIFRGANWFEREVWDMYGIVFEGHSDLRRILTDYTFDGHPLRKDFPLSGYTELRYDDKLKKIIHEPVKLPQAYRDFDFTSPWKNTVAILPGDEKAINNDHNNNSSVQVDEELVNK